MEPRIKDMTSPNDDVVVVALGTNNVPTDSVGTCITKIGRVIDYTKRLNPDSRLVIPEIPHRFDRKELNASIDKINQFIHHKCNKMDNTYSVRHDFTRGDYSADGLHLSYSGKVKYARCIQDIVCKSD